jgi:sortase A
MNDVTDLADGTKITWSPIPKKPKGRLLAQIIGEILLTLGLVLLLFVGYKMLQDKVVAVQQTELAQKQPGNNFVELDKVSKLADIFARMYVPRFGSDWTRLIAEGTRWHPVLNEIGVGHYTNTAMPGDVGNFAIAGHRGGFGGAFKNIHELVAGDRVYIETKHTWFVYKFLQTKIVAPNELGVIKPVPDKLDGATAGGRYLTMTSCTPIFVNTSRIISWFELERSLPVPQGPPAELHLEKKAH